MLGHPARVPAGSAVAQRLHEPGRAGQRLCRCLRLLDDTELALSQRGSGRYARATGTCPGSFVGAVPGPGLPVLAGDRVAWILGGTEGQS